MNFEFINIKQQEALQLKKKIIEFVEEEFKKNDGFKKTKREGKEVVLKIDLDYNEEPNKIKFIFDGTKEDLQMLKEDEVGVGSKNIPVKANVQKLQNSLRYFVKSKGGQERR